MSSLSLNGVSKAFAGTQVLSGISLEIASGEFFSLLGPSGCGKSTLLRIIAGLETPDSGVVAVNGSTINHVPPQRRGIGMVFQQYALWPHMTIAQNVRFGLESQQLSETERDGRMKRALERVQMLSFMSRYPHEISGGQQQRVALARALALQPAIILLDEPLSNLDARLRVEIRQELSELHRTLGTTTIYVTHDQEDALALSSRIAVMHSGTIQQVGAPREIFEHPRSVFTARFIGDANLLPCTVHSTRGDTTTVELDDLRGRTIEVQSGGVLLQVASPCFLCLRPHALHITPVTAGAVTGGAVTGGAVTGGAGSQDLRARIERVTYKGANYQVELRLGAATTLSAFVSTGAEALREGDEVVLTWSQEAGVLVPHEQ
jgi:putative spermidine/putrescine transport system ATP-binding protein